MNASRMRRLSCALLAAALATAMLSARTQRSFEYRQVHMGLPVRILLHTPDRQRAEAAARAAFARIEALDRVLSDYRPDSELRQLERTSGQWTTVTPPLLAVLEVALSVAAATDGLFDPTIGPLVALWRESRISGTLPEPSAVARARSLVDWRQIDLDRTRGAVRRPSPGMRLDLGGVAKGYVLQQALDTVQRAGIDSALVESGGDIVVGGAPPGRSGWHVDAPGADPAFMRHARSLTHAALATSGSTAQFVEIAGVRYSHLVDPRTGLGVTRRVAAYVIARDAATADALATAAAIASPTELEGIRRRFPQTYISVKSTAGSSKCCN